jgi:hypothetical protein
MVKLVGGDKLTAALDKIAQKVSKAASVEVGFLEGATYPDGTSVALVAALNEFGSGNKVSHQIARALGLSAPAPVPPRPFFRGMIKDKSGQWPKAVGDLLVANSYDAEKTLDQAGAAIAGQLQEAITQYVGPPLRPSTVKRKGNAKQLVDTGVMLRSVDHVVK